MFQPSNPANGSVGFVGAYKISSFITKDEHEASQLSRTKVQKIVTIMLVVLVVVPREVRNKKTVCMVRLYLYSTIRYFILIKHVSFRLQGMFTLYKVLLLNNIDVE